MVLFVFSLVTVAIEVQWLTFAPIAREARLFYGATALQIDLLSLSFMIIFLVMCIPASFVIDTRGIRIGVGTGALLTAAFSITKGVFAHDFALVLASQVGLAIAQPFIINASTKVAVQWFPVHERATAVGIATLSQFVGIIVAMVATPMLIHASPSGKYDLAGMLRIYGAACAVAALLLLAFLRERPAGDASLPHDRVPAGFFAGLKHILMLRDMQVVLVVFFVGLGAFNAISTCIDQIGERKGFSMAQASLVGGLMLAAGIRRRTHPAAPFRPPEETERVFWCWPWPVFSRHWRAWPFPRAIPWFWSAHLSSVFFCWARAARSASSTARRYACLRRNPPPRG